MPALKEKIHYLPLSATQIYEFVFHPRSRSTVVTGRQSPVAGNCIGHLFGQLLQF
jgi:hypothetical protein